eukprot:1158623-Pelagomonas_calceolata.AAC.2
MGRHTYPCTVHVYRNYKGKRPQSRRLIASLHVHVYSAHSPAQVPALIKQQAASCACSGCAVHSTTSCHKM